MKPRILQQGSHPAYEALLVREFDVHPLYKEIDPKAFLAQHGGEFVGLATTAKWGADEALMAALPNLQVISSFGVGYETIDLEAAKRRGIRVGYTPDVLTDCVADLAFALVLDVARGTPAADRFVRRGDWLKGNFPIMTRVSGKKLGIVGLGRIGSAIARRAGGFDMTIRYHNRKPLAGSPFGYEASLVELARWADFLVVAAAAGAATRKLISREVLDALGPEGHLINIARGSVVDEAALVEALESKRIGGAGLDVFENEPQIPERLFALDNVVLLPHIASATKETRAAMANLAMDNLRSWFREGRLVTALV